MKLSVVITCYNYATFLPKAIQSCLNQSVLPHEIIVVNDGSTDNTDEVIQSYLPKVLYIKQSNRGVSSARNTGIMNATGDWILPLDADDTLSPFYLADIENAIEHAITAPDVVYCDLQHTGDRNDIIPCVAPITKENLALNNLLPYCSAIRKSLLLQCGGYNVKMIYGWEDYELWMELFERGAVFYHIPAIDFFYHRHGSTMLSVSYTPEAVEYSTGILKKIHPSLYE